VQFVERFDARQSVEDAKRLTGPLRSGTSAVVFPEGTFTRTPGLASFHLGGFAAAVAARASVLPAAIRGTRTLLRSGNWLPRRGTVAVTIGSPLLPSSSATDAFTAAVALRDAARAHILAHCGEPDVGSG